MVQDERDLKKKCSLSVLPRTHKQGRPCHILRQRTGWSALWTRGLVLCYVNKGRASFVSRGTMFVVLPLLLEAKYLKGREAWSRFCSSTFELQRVVGWDPAVTEQNLAPGMEREQQHITIRLKITVKFKIQCGRVRYTEIINRTQNRSSTAWHRVLW
jgi:hypothetical protein